MLRSSFGAKSFLLTIRHVTATKQTIVMPPRESNAFLNALKANDPASAVIEVAGQLQQSASLNFQKKEVTKIVDLLGQVALTEG